MVELRLQRVGNMLDVQVGDCTATVPLRDVAVHETTWEHIFDDAIAYGRDLFEKTFRTEQMRSLLADLPARERLALVADDPVVTAIPWEYLRDTNGKLLAARSAFVRSLPPEQRRADFSFAGALDIIAVPVSPIDESRTLNTEREWRNLVTAVSTLGADSMLTAKRVRPPTLKQMTRAVRRQATTIVHFMGHSSSTGSKAVLAFEDARACTHFVDAADFADAFPHAVFLVIMTSCLSAVGATTTFGNIAHTLVRRHIPYALGMQYVLPDDAALVLSEALYDGLLRGWSVEEAVMQVRQALEELGNLVKPHWLAGIPVLYTSLHTPAPPLELSSGKPALVPDPLQLEQTCDVTALPSVYSFVGRSKEIGKVLETLLSPHARGFVLLRGLGGIGKTALARTIAERVSWHYQDRVLAISFETFSHLEAENQTVINVQFADTFYNRLARFYGLDTSDVQRYPTTTSLQQAILQRRAHVRSLLVLDNIETLIDALKNQHPEAQALATFLSRLGEGDGAILCTSRMDLPSAWGQSITVPVYGLVDDAGAELFLALLPTERQPVATNPERLALSRRVQGHPLSIRLLAARFAEPTSDLATFLQHIEEELTVAEQATPTSLEDPDRQKTLYACLAYSIKRLSPEQARVLHATSIFKTPFLAEFAARVTGDEQTPQHLQTLVRLSLLETSLKTFKEGELVLLELHPTVRWYLQYHMPPLDADLQERYGEVYQQLARQGYDDYDKDARVRYLLRQSLADCDSALLSLPPSARSAFAYFLARPYQRLGQNQRAIKLYEQSLEIDQELGDLRGVAVTQSAMADVLRQQGKPQEAMALYEQSLRTTQELGDLREVAVTQANLSQLLCQLGEYARGLSLAWQAYSSLEQHGYAYDAGIMRQLLLSMKAQVSGPEQFDGFWTQVIRDPMPVWLHEGENRREQEGISAEQLRVIIANTVAVLTAVPEKRDEWYEKITETLQEVQRLNRLHDMAFFTALLALLEGQKPSLPEDHPYNAALTQILAGIAAGGRQEESNAGAVSDEIMQAIRDYVNAEDWEATRRVVEVQQERLYDPLVETIFEQNIAAARKEDEERAVHLLELHLALLRECRVSGIEAAFSKMLEQQEAEPLFDDELIPRSIKALLGGPQEKMAHAQYLITMAQDVSDEGLKALLDTIQLALFSRDLDLSLFGGELQGVYKEAWGAIALGVETGGVDPRTFEAIATNTLVVLGSVAAQRSEWRGNLVDVRNAATARGDRHMGVLLDAVLGLLDANGNSAGLGEGLQGVYARTWQAIVEHLP